ncbi:unnamed protein product [Amaranthus hypochondriacus]
MQDPSSLTAAAFSQLKTPQFPEQEQLKCPRCDSTNTKFCYYNNYNLSQPRHYCKSCKRYWTKGGALRNIPIGGGSRKITKRSSSKRSSSSSPAQTQLRSSGSGSDSGQNPGTDLKPVLTPVSEAGSGLGYTASGVGVGVESFTSLLGLASEGQFNNLLIENLGSNGLRLGQGDGSGQNPGLEMLQENKYNGSTSSEGLMMGGVDLSCWNGNSNGWPDLAIYTPGSKFK